VRFPESHTAELERRRVTGGKLFILMMLRVLCTLANENLGIFMSFVKYEGRQLDTHTQLSNRRLNKGLCLFGKPKRKVHDV
jgi:hypothetical protein